MAKTDPVTGKVTYDTEFKRDAAQEAKGALEPSTIANAKSWNMTPKQYIEARGGVNASGYYGDTFNSEYMLTDAEYAAAAASGTVAAASSKKMSSSNFVFNNPVDQGSNSGDGTGSPAYNALSNQYANLQSQFNDFLTQQNEANAAANAAKLATRQSAIAVMTDRLKQYHLESLAPIMLSLAQQDAGEDTIMLVLQETPEYKERFKANKTRIAKGLAVLTPKEYLAVEDSHRQVLRAAGLSRFDNDAYVSQFMENDMSANELSSRIDLAVNRVQNGDPDTMEQLRMYGLDTADLVAYMLDPKQVLPDIERKVATAEIGAAGRKNDLYVSAGTAGDLAARGVTKAQAEQGYSAIASILPGAKKLSEIYGKVQPKYGLGDAESEVFGNLASAKRAREALVRSEEATFSASSGRSRNALNKGL